MNRIKFKELQERIAAVETQVGEIQDRLDASTVPKTPAKPTFGIDETNPPPRKRKAKRK